MNAHQGHGMFQTLVHTLPRVPLPIAILTWLLLAVNVFGFVAMVSGLDRVIPGIGTSNEVKAAGYMMAARQLGVAIVFALAFFSKNVRFMQLGWGLAALREIGDVPSAVAQGGLIAGLAMAALIAAEIAIFVWLGAVAAGRIARYAPAGEPRRI